MFRGLLGDQSMDREDPGDQRDHGDEGDHAKHIQNGNHPKQLASELRVTVPDLEKTMQDRIKEAW